MIVSGKIAWSIWFDAAAPIIAALSVHRIGAGIYTGILLFCKKRSRKFLLAATPPAIIIDLALRSSAAANVFLVNTSTTESWNAHAISLADLFDSVLI